jgi:hypothetical protein
MAKLFQLTVFLNFVVVGIALGYGRTHMNRKRMAMLFFGYVFVYLAFALLVLSDTTFLVPQP